MAPFRRMRLPLNIPSIGMNTGIKPSSDLFPAHREVFETGGLCHDGRYVVCVRRKQ